MSTEIFTPATDLSQLAGERFSREHGGWYTDLVAARNTCEVIGDSLHSVADAMPWMREYHRLAQVVGYSAKYRV